MDEKQAFYVRGVDGRTFKMVIRGDLGKLTVVKIRRHLSLYGVPDGQILLHHGVVVPDNAEGSDFGLCSNATLQLVSPRSYAKAADDAAVESGLALPVRRDVFAGAATTPKTPEDRGVKSGPGSAFVASNYVDSSEDNKLSSFAAQLSRDHSTGAGRSSSTSRNNMSSNNNNNNMFPVDNQNADGHTYQSPLTSALSVAMEAENKQLRDELRRLRQELADVQLAQRNSKNAAGGNSNNNNHHHHHPQSTRREATDVFQNARANLQELAENLGVALKFDANFTSVVGSNERNTVLITFDHATERLYVYGTLLTSLPDDAALRVKLYELLLEGSLLGREVCGGGIGMSLQNGVVMLTTTIPLRFCGSSALKDIMPSFVETLARWRSLTNELVS